MIAVRYIYPQAPALAIFQVRDAQGSVIGEGATPEIATRFAASDAAMRACTLITAAYEAGAPESSACWQLLDQAHAAARTAMASSVAPPESRPVGFAAKEYQRDGATGQGRGV